MAQRSKRGGGRDRTSSAQFLNNKQFAYLFEKSSHKASSYLPNGAGKSPLAEASDEEDADNSPFISVSPPTNSNGNNNNNNAYNDMNKIKNHRRKKSKNKHIKPRTSSIQVSTTKTENEQLNAIKKEVEFLTSEVPHFRDIYLESQSQFALSKRNKADTEAFALIQGLTQWIHLYGNQAVKQYDEFKQSAETEILNMVTRMESMTLENSKLNMIIEEHEREKHELKDDLQQQQMLVIKYQKDEQQRNEDNEVQESNQARIDALEAQLEQYKNKNKSLQEKYERVEKYWKMTQDENDELRNKNYAMEEEVQGLKDNIRSTNTNMANMKLKHATTLQNLQIEHNQYAKQMQSEQEKLIQAQQEATKATQVMTPTGGLGAGYTIDADDADIQGSGITDDGPEEFETMGGIVSLENEINVYEYEDDEWLDETDSDFEEDEDEDEEEEIEATPEPQPQPEPEEEDKTLGFEMIKESHYKDIERRDISEGFSSSKMTFGQEQASKTVQFAMESQKYEMEREKQEVPEPIKKEESPEPMQFESEKMKIEVEAIPKQKSLDLQMSSTAMSHTPQMESPPMEFEMEMKSQQVSMEKKEPMEFSSMSTGAMGQKNELINKKDMPKPLKRVIYIERGPKKDDKLVMGGRNFAERLAMFKHLEETKGGKPKVLEEARAYKLINSWQAKNAKNDKLKANPLNKITKSTKNVHVTKSTVHTLTDSQNRAKQVNVLKITKSKVHTLKPRLFGYMNIIRSAFIPRWKMTQQPRYFFVLDGLPSQTNTNEKEPDFAKNRKHDFLVPTLFFFQDKDDYDTFASQVKDVPTRDIKFQKLFAQYAKGTFPLNTYAMDINVFQCTKRVNKLMKRDDIKLPLNEINDCGTVNDLTILLCNDKEIHRFSCNDKFSRNKWIKKVNKLVDKRTQRLQNINNGLLGINSPQLTNNGVRKSIGNGMDDIDDAMSTGNSTPASVIGTPVGSFNNIIHPDNDNDDENHMFNSRKSRASMYKLSKIKQVEADFD